MAKTDFTVNVEPAIRGFFTADTAGDEVETVNNAVENTVFAEIHGFETGTGADAPEAVEFTAIDKDGETYELGSVPASDLDNAEAERGSLTIAANRLPVGDVTITATQNGTTATAVLTVITPTLTLSPTSADASKAVILTATGTNFGTGTALTFPASPDSPADNEVSIAVTTKDAADADDPVSGVTPATEGYDAVGTTGFTQRITLPFGTDPDSITVKATVTGAAVAPAATGSYVAMATFTLNPAPPAQVQNVVVTPGEANLAVTWTQVGAVNEADESRPAAG